MNGLVSSLKGRLIVSCQARPGDPFRDADSMARFARAVVAGGAAGIRADSAAHIKAIRAAVSVPIIGIDKQTAVDGKILITPSFERARDLVAAGSDFIAIDCTGRGRRFGALERVAAIKSGLGVPVMADIATVEEALEAARAGADFVLSTMRGYTDDTEWVKSLDLVFLRELVQASAAPAIAEGRIETPEQAVQALEAGAFAVIVGKAITRPQTICERFAGAMRRAAAA